jgi:uncharacterized protein (AIM24 family)
VRGSLFDNAEVASAPGAFARQNDRMLKVDLAGTDGHFLARQGSMVAYQGEVDFAYQGSGGMAKMFKKAVTGEGMSLMKVTGTGQVFLAHQADEVAVVELEGDSCTVNGDSVLAFTSGLTWDINRAEGASVLSGGLFNTTFTGHGMLAVTVFGTPVALRVDVPTYVDMQSVVLWTSGLNTSIRKTVKAAAAIGRGSGEAYQLCLAGDGIVVVQASEGHPAPRHS